MKQIFVGKTVKETRELAIKELGIDVSRISFEIIEEPKKTLFGKIKGEAKIVASFDETKVDIAAAYIRKVLKSMGLLNTEVKISESEDSAVIEILGEDCDILIGKKADTLDSLQYLTSLICNKGDKEYYRITLDTCGYREKRKSHLEVLTAKMSESVKKNGVSSALEPMNPYERRIVHSKVSEIEGVSSRSSGDEPFRKVIISSTIKKTFERKPGFNNNNSANGNNFNKRPEIKATSFDIKTSFEKDYKKPRPEDNLTSGLYSKIDF